MSNFSYYKIAGKLHIKLMALCSFTKGTAVQRIFLRYSVSIFVLYIGLYQKLKQMNKIYKHLSHSLFLCISPSLIKVSCGPHFYISSSSHTFLMYRYKDLTQGVFTNLVVVYERQHRVLLFSLFSQHFLYVM